MQQVGRLAALGGGALLLLVVWKKAASTGRRSRSRGGLAAIQGGVRVRQSTRG